MHRNARLVQLLIASFIVKLLVLIGLYSVDPSRIVASDTASYENPARALIALGRFSASVEEPSRVETLRTPGYPAFIAAIFVVSRESRLAVAIVQIAVSTVTIGLTFYLASLFWSPAVALAGALILALDPLSFVYSPLLHSETLFSCAIVLTGVAGVAMMRSSGPRTALLFGSAMACATLIRPIAYYFFFPALVALLVRAFMTGQPLRKIAVLALAALVPWLALVEGWRLRNYVQAGRAEIASIASVNLAWYRGAGIIAARDGISFWEARDRLAASLPDTTGWSPGEISALYEREGLRLILAHPALFVRAQLFGIVKIVAGPGRTDLLHYFAGVPYEDTAEDAIDLSAASVQRRLQSDNAFGLIPLGYAIFYLAALYTSVALGLWRMWRMLRMWRCERYSWVEHGFLWSLILYLVVLAAGPEAYARFRIPVMPLLAIYAGLGVFALRPRPAASPA